MTTTKYFLDTEFIEDGKTIDLISIGLVREDGATLYLQNSECNFTKASDWVWRNVFPHLIHFSMRGCRSCCGQARSYDSGLEHRTSTKCTDSLIEPCFWANRREIADNVMDFCDPTQHGKPEFWGYFADYDWVAFCQLFGSMIDLPKGFPRYCRDIKQWADALGEIQLPKPVLANHHALHDAIWTAEAYEFLAKRSNP